MLPRTFSLSHCTGLSILNVLGFFLFARYAEAMGFVGEQALGNFSVSVGIITMLVTGALLVWSAMDHFLDEPTGNTALALSVNLGFMCAFVLM
jgi:cytosine/uracil/thiamine/allantoin permease